MTSDPVDLAAMPEAAFLTGLIDDACQGDSLPMLVYRIALRAGWTEERAFALAEDLADRPRVRPRRAAIIADIDRQLAELERERARLRRVIGVIAVVLFVPRIIGRGISSLWHRIASVLRPARVRWGWDADGRAWSAQYVAEHVEQRLPAGQPCASVGAGLDASHEARSTEAIGGGGDRVADQLGDLGAPIVGVEAPATGRAGRAGEQSEGDDRDGRGDREGDDNAHGHGDLRR
jgi:hypothetical protein